MPIRHLIGGLLLVAGAALLLSALWPEGDQWEIVKEPLPVPSDLVSQYRATAFERWDISRKQSGRRLTFHVLHYQDRNGTKRQTLMPDPGSRSWQEWMELARTLRNQVEKDALILSWWEDAQRIDFLTGLGSWVRQPPVEAFPRSERTLWQPLSGGFSGKTDKLAQLANWLTQEREHAPDEIRRMHPETSLYLLVTTSDLSHVDEIERLAKLRLPLELRFFPSTGNLHGRISTVQAWAQETGGVYLPQAIPGGIAAWRVTRLDPVPLLLRLLPFTYPQKQPPATITLVYRSPGGKMWLYKIIRDENGDRP